MKNEHTSIIMDHYVIILSWTILDTTVHIPYFKLYTAALVWWRLINYPAPPMVCVVVIIDVIFNSGYIMVL
jgi:hypothetical protein